MRSPSSAEGRGGERRGGERRRVALLGSTGSIGRQTLDVLAGLADRFEVVALVAGRNEGLLQEQAARHRPRVSILAGEDPGPLAEVASRDDVDIVVVATGGMVSLRAVIAALAAGTVVATANKETLVAAGHLVMPLARALATAAREERSGLAAATDALAWLRPIDSEHSAIWQCLVGEPDGSIERLILTASGGPFRDATPAQLAAVTVEQALRHPTWSMGRKITIDSATLANKGLEVIEAHWLYDVGYDAIEVVIHPQSVVHSAVRFVDGSLKAQLGTPDMRLPIQYALTFPERLASAAASVDLIAAGRLDFRAPDEGRFPALRIAREAALAGPWATAAYIAADEVAVERFLAGSLAFTDIPHVLEAAVNRFAASAVSPPDVDELLALDLEVRRSSASVRAGAAT
jgi:1-deoxy-D-xylulose-5-phosphate reductoisomerase